MKNIFVIGLNEFNLQKLQKIRNAENYRFHPLLSSEDVLEQEKYDIEGILSKAASQLRSFDGSIDGIIHYIDFPASTSVPLLCRKFDLPSASFEAVLKCEHKYWSRLEQKRTVPDHVPEFACFDPFDDDALKKMDLDFPFWIKPIKSFSSYLGFRIGNEQEFHDCCVIIRENIGRFEEPFNHLLNLADLPAEVAEVGGGMCIAENIISGRQCTLECYVYRGKVHTYGVVDSIREANRTSFSRYQYPSRLPKRVQKRMHKIAQQIMTHIGYNEAPFNIEFFWDEAHNHIWLLEINPRISASHCELFEDVDGVSSHDIAVELSIGNEPEPLRHIGEFNCAAKFFLRKHEDAYVEAVPDESVVRRLEEEMPGTTIHIQVHPGMWLSELMDQDSYTYILAIMWLGGRHQRELLKKYNRCVRALKFRLAKRPFA
ncbi:MAG: ATP-grasp domain-containing protein [Gammaproteobacteria bacterium]